jgi:hypothetical protein
METNRTTEDCVSRQRRLARHGQAGSRTNPRIVFKILSTFLFPLCLLVSAGTGWSQSTFGSFVGTVRDPSGGVVANAGVQIQNLGTSLVRTATTDQSGSYVVVNLEPGNYEIKIEAEGFQAITYKDLVLQARQTIRVDGALTIGTKIQAISVEETAAVLNTDVSNLAETKTGRELVDLPVAIASRASGSTSAITTLTTQPGVLIDNSGNLSVAGSKPAMLSVSIDGISSMSPRSYVPIAELFPSFNAIAEIRVSEVNNSAEFGGISDITTISRGGSNDLHGGLFENNQAAAYDARSPFVAAKAKLVMNDFGVFGGGPVSIPKLYNGHNRTFFFGSYEGLRLPRESPLVISVPSVALRAGNLSAYSKAVLDPAAGGTPFQNNQIPATRVAPLSAAALQYLFPLPNSGAPGAIANNWASNIPTPISSNQGDFRLDQNIDSKQTAFARVTYKRRAVEIAPTGTVMTGPISQPENDFSVSGAYNYVVTPHLVNELRAGYTGSNSSTDFGLSASTIQSELGLQLPGPPPPGAAVPNFNISGFTATSATYTQFSRTATRQLIDNVTFTRGGHTLKMGGDYRYLTGYYNGNFASTRMGQFNFNNSVTASTIGNPFGAFLLGIPDSDSVATVTATDADAHAQHYAAFVQDDWKVSPSLTLNFGLRYEYHPMFSDSLHNTATFLPDYESVVNGVLVRGAVVVPDARINGLDEDLVQSVAPTPFVTASQVGLPQTLRNSQKTDFAPRFGFAWRPLGNDQTVIRGGYGKYIETLLGNAMFSQWGVPTSYNGQFTNSFVNGKPTLAFPYPFPSSLAAAPGTAQFLAGIDSNYKDPYVQQWNFTIERDLGFSTGVRASYDGSHGSQLGYYIDGNQVPANTVGYNAVAAYRPYPSWSYVKLNINGARSNYDAFTVVANRRFSRGLQVYAAYVYAKNLSNEAGYNPSAFTGENGGSVTDRYNINLDYGNVAFTRRDRFEANVLYDLPFGKGRTLLGHANRALDGIVGGWELAGVLLFQTGPFLTVTVPGADPAGNNFDNSIGSGGGGAGSGRADIVSGVPLYPAVQSQSLWINKAAFAVPPNNIGRDPDSPVGAVVGPGTQSVSVSLFKSIRFTERVSLQIGASAANALNHLNLGTPNLSFTTAAFGTITSTQSAEGAAPRTVQLTARLKF